MGKWERKTLKDADVRVLKGEGLTSDKMLPGEIPVIAGGLSYCGMHNRANRNENCITVSASGANAGAVLFHRSKIFATDCSSIEWGGSQEFLYYALARRQKEFTSMQSGLAQPHVYPRDIEKFMLFYPTDTKEQHNIAAVLTSTDEAIAVSRALIEKYAAVKQGLVHDLFNQGKREKVCLGEVTEKIADRDHTTPVYVERGVYIVSPKDFDGFDQIDFSHCAKISLHDHLINRKKTDIRSGDLIFTRIGAGLGKICIVEDGMPEFSILHSAAMIRCNSRVLAKYLMYRIKTFEVQKQIKDGIQSIGVPDLGMDKINEISFLIHPDKNEQERIVEILTAADEHLTAERERLRKLEDIKRGLMDDLLTNRVSTDILQGGN